MTVKQLIESLSKFDPEFKILLCFDARDFGYGEQLAVWVDVDHVKKEVAIGS